MDWKTFVGLLAGTILIGGVLMPVLKKEKVGQQVREDGPQAHLSKSGTPTFGGLFFLIPLTLLGIGRIFFTGGLDHYTGVLLLALLFGGVGFLDDYTKVRVDKGGLSVRKKILWLGIASVLFTVWFLYLAPQPPILRLPAGGTVVMIEGLWKPIYGVFCILFLFFFSNAVNLTDGEDGLCSGVTLVASLSLAACIRLAAQGAETGAMVPLQIFLMALAGGMAGFLLFNHHPARVFMGDTGSQALGAALAGCALLAGIPWVLLILGFVYCAEGLSTLLQVGYFKLTKGKRLFKMAPLHHHFELSGWSENKIVLIFSLVTLVGGLLSLLLI